MRFIFIFLVSIVLYSCSFQEEVQFSSVTSTTIFNDSLSIRAISPLDNKNVWFAANKGIVGLISDGVPKLATIRYEDKLLNFRSIAHTSSAVFVLSIENPAVLYRIGYKNNEATNIEEVYNENGSNVFYDSMAFWDEKNGIAMGDPIGGCLSIIITNDGGSTWNKVPCTALPAIEKGEAAFAASNTNISLYKNNVWIATGGARSRVFHSSNRGNTWEVFNTPIVQGSAMTGIYSISFYDEMNGIIFGGNWEEKTDNNSNKAITQDGGRTWALISEGKGPGYRSCVQYVPNTNGEGIVAVGSPGISYSSDGGKSWNELSKEGFYAIKFVNDSTAFASGANKISILEFN